MTDQSPPAVPAPADQPPLYGQASASPQAPAYPPPAYGQQYPPAYPAPRRTNGLAIASFVLGLLGFAIIPVIMGHVALKQIRERGDDGSVFAIIGLVLGYLGIAAWVLIVLAVAIPLIAVGVSGGFSS